MPPLALAARSLARGRGRRGLSGFSLGSLFKKGGGPEPVLPPGVPFAKAPEGVPPIKKWAKKVANEAYGSVCGVQAAGAEASDIAGSGLLVHPLGLVLTARRNCLPPDAAEEARPGDAAVRDDLQVVLRNRTVAPARVVAECAEADVALLQLDAGDMTFAYVPLAGPEARPAAGQQVVMLSADDSDSWKERLRQWMGGGETGELAVRVLLATVSHWIGAGTMFVSPSVDATLLRRASDSPFRRHAGGFAFNHEGEAVGMLSCAHMGSPHAQPSEAVQPVLVPVDTVRQAVGASLLDMPPRPVGIFGADAVPVDELDADAQERLAQRGVDLAAGGLYLKSVSEEGLADHLDLARGDVIVAFDDVPVVRPMSHLALPAGEMPLQLTQWLRRSFGAHTMTIRRRRGQHQYGAPERLRVNFTRETAWDPLAPEWDLYAAAEAEGARQ